MKSSFTGTTKEGLDFTAIEHRTSVDEFSLESNGRGDLRTDYFETDAGKEGIPLLVKAEDRIVFLIPDDGKLDFEAIKGCEGCLITGGFMPEIKSIMAEIVFMKDGRSSVGMVISENAMRDFPPLTLAYPCNMLSVLAENHGEILRAPVVFQAAAKLPHNKLNPEDGERHSRLADLLKNADEDNH